MTGTFVPNQASTPLLLGGINLAPVSNTTLLIKGCDSVASNGVLGAVGAVRCNIPTALATHTCAVNIVY